MKPKITVIFAALFLSAISLAAIDIPTKRPLAMAHRGGFAETDENTVKAYENAIAKGIDIIECDPKLTKDGKWIIMHDQTLERTTDSTGNVADTTFEQFQKIRTKGGEKIPTLEEVLDIGKKGGVIVFLDMHIPPPDLAAFFKIVEEHGMIDRVIVNMWKKPFQLELKKAYPNIVTCFPYPKPAASVKACKKVNAQIIGTLPAFASKRMIKKAHALGMAVVTMPINDEVQMRKFVARGLDIIQTDDPRITEIVLGNPRKVASNRLRKIEIDPMALLFAAR